MPGTPRVIAGVVLVAALAVSAPAVAVDATRPAESRVLHRVVWDMSKPHGVLGGLHLSSANVDGSDVRRIYDNPNAFTTELNLDHRGRRVAFSVCCWERFPRLLVAPVLGGDLVKPLARHPRIHSVGDDIAWSPNGRRLAFLGSVMRGDHPVRSLWTVRLDGTALRRILRLPGGDEGSTVVWLTWTREGIIYSDGESLRLVHGGTSTVIQPKLFAFQASGDGRHVVTAGPKSAWYGTPTHLRHRRLTLSFRGARFDLPELSYNGRSLLAERHRTRPDGYGSSDVVIWKVGQDPRSGTVLRWLPDRMMSVTWN